VASFVVIALIVLGSYQLFFLLDAVVAGFIVSALWLIMAWSVYDDYNNDDPFD